MTQQQGSLSVERLCTLAQVSRAGYYRHWQAVAPRTAETALRDEVQRLALADRHCGYRRIAESLQRAGWQVNHKRVLRLMREDNLLCLRKKAFVPATTDSRHSWRIYPNLAWRLKPTGMNQLWVADITYVRLAEGYAYLAVILDAFSRRAIGWAMAEHLKTTLTLAALEMALTSRDITPGLLVHHSDRGVQYACGDYISRLEAHGMQPSPYDNAMAESFMKTLKKEEVDGRRYRDLAQARASIEYFLAEVYNCQRLHSALDYNTPAKIEANPTLLSSVMKRSTAGSTATCPDFAVSP
jgi:putative transposase